MLLYIVRSCVLLTKELPILVHECSYEPLYYTNLYTIYIASEYPYRSAELIMCKYCMHIVCSFYLFNSEQRSRDYQIQILALYPH